MKDDDYPKEFRNTILFAVLGFLVAGFILILPDGIIKVSVAYTILASLGVVLFTTFPLIYKYRTYQKNRKLSDTLYGVDKNPIGGLIIGMVIGGLFIFLTTIKAFAVLNLAVPQVPLSLSASAFVICVVAPIVETIFFTMIFSILGLFMNWKIALGLRALAFTLYHYVTYIILGSSNVGAIWGAFIGAFIFSIIGGILAKYYGAESDWGAHLFINSWNFNSVYGFFVAM